MESLDDSALVTAQNQAYGFTFETCPKRVRVSFDGLVVADSARTVILRETRLAPVHYFPRHDVRMDLLQPTDLATHCPFRGNASYWTLCGPERIAENAVWSYPTPYAEGAPIAGMLAFDAESVDAVLVEGAADASIQPAAAVLPSNPYAEWLIRDGWRQESVAEQVAALAHCLERSGACLVRLRLIIRTLHPQLFSYGYTWSRGRAEIETRELPHAVLHSEEYLDSPLYPIFEGAGGVRRRLDVPEPEFDYPILRTLQAEGATDYVAMPLVFSDGQINVISLVGDRPGGFTTSELGHLYEILPLLAHTFEVRAQRRTAVTLLDTYLGRHTGRRVLEGRVRHGDGEDLYAVIWFCDLRDSTRLADSMPRSAFLDLLNRYFDCMAGAVLAHEGEVLRFIGDAVLAIFPIGQPTEEHPLGCARTAAACRNALASARDARERMRVCNQDRVAAGDSALRYGIGLHLGDVTYGNIGTPERLEFTVIGAAANEAARIESLCKTLEHPILASAELAAHVPDALRPLGRQQLRGVGTQREIYGLPDDA